MGRFFTNYYPSVTPMPKYHPINRAFTPIYGPAYFVSVSKAVTPARNAGLKERPPSALVFLVAAKKGRERKGADVSGCNDTTTARCIHEVAFAEPHPEGEGRSVLIKRTIAIKDIYVPSSGG